MHISIQIGSELTEFLCSCHWLWQHSGKTPTSPPTGHGFMSHHPPPLEEKISKILKKLFNIIFSIELIF